MNPPLLPPVTSITEAKEAYAEPREEFLGEEEVSPSKFSEITCSPTPSPAGEGKAEGSRAEGDEKHMKDLKESALSGELLDKVGTMDLVFDPEVNQAGNSSSAEEPKVTGESDPVSDSAHPAGSKNMAFALNMNGTANDVAYTGDRSSAADAIQSPTKFHDTVETHGKTNADASAASGERRGRKRKLKEIKVNDSNLASSDSEVNFGRDAELPEASVVSTKTKLSDVTKGRTRVTKKLVQPKGSRQKSALRDRTPNNNIPQPSSRRSRRRSGGSSPAGYVGPAPVVIFSGSTSIQDDRATMAAFERLGGKVGMTINDATVLCIPEGPVKKTGKLVMAVAKGIDIVTEKWIADSRRLGRFPSLGQYLPHDGVQQRAWRCNLRDAIHRGKKGLTHLLSGTTVYLTKELRRSLGNLEQEISQIAWILGAEAVERRLPALKDKDTLSQTGVLVIGVRNDPQGGLVGRLGQVLFNKDILTMAALRGRLERDSEEFVIEVPIKEEDEEL
jgi:hypothetical protein